MKQLHVANIVPIKHTMENEVSEVLETLIGEYYNMGLELVPLGGHIHNAADVDILNFKSHFISILVGVTYDFPKDLWGWILPQAEVTINLLRLSNATAAVSAYAHMSGLFHYNKMLLAPLGCQVQVHTPRLGTNPQLRRKEAYTILENNIYIRQVPSQYFHFAIILWPLP